MPDTECLYSVVTFNSVCSVKSRIQYNISALKVFNYTLIYAN